MEVIWLDFWEKIRGNEKGGNDFREKENVRRGLLGAFEKDVMMVRGELQFEQVGEGSLVNR